MYIYGKNVVREKLNTDERVVRGYLSRKFHDQEILQLLKNKRVKITYLDDRMMKQKVDGLFITNQEG